MKKLLVIIALHASIASVGQTVNIRVDSIVNFGTQEFLARNFEAAFDATFEAIRIAPKNPKGYFLRAVIASKIELYDDAIDDFTEVILLDSLISDAWYNRGICKGILEDYEDAMLDINKAILIAPYEAKYYAERGRCWYAIGRIESSLLDYNRAIQFNPFEPDYVYNRAIILLRLNNPNLALVDLNNLISENPANQQYLLKRGQCKESLKDYRGAISDYKQAINIDPSKPEGYHKLGTLYEFKQKDTTSALVSYIKLMYYSIPKVPKKLDEVEITYSLFDHIVVPSYEELLSLARLAIERKRDIDYFLRVLEEIGYARDEILLAEQLYLMVKTGGLLE